MSNGILLQGLDGSNPLAFLAALGTLRTLTLALPTEKVRMSWEIFEGAWRPRVWCSITVDILAERLDDELRKSEIRHSFTIGDNLNLPFKELRSHMLVALSKLDNYNSHLDRDDVDYLAAFGSDAIFDDNEIMADTALRTMSGAGHQHFLKFFRELIRKTDSEHLQRALLKQWDYADEGRGMNLRWDPLDDRRYAMRWENPSGDPVKTMLGANRLAIEALPLLPTMPVNGTLTTTAFAGKGARDTYFTWPIWQAPLTMKVICSLLSMTASIADKNEHRAAVGILAVFSSARITTGKFRNFTPATPQ